VSLSAGASAGKGAARGSSGRNAASSGGGGPAQVAYDGWEFWWEANRDRFVLLKSRLGRNSPVPGSPGQLTSRGNKGQATSGTRPTRSWIEAELVPALLSISTSTDDRDILDSALIALGRSASADQHAVVRATAERLLGHSELSVQAAAALGLGILDDRASEELLTQLLQDTSAGQQAVGRGKVPWLVRAFSAIGLGLMGSDTAVDSLLSALEQLPDSERDIKSCALAALGLLEHSSARRDQVVDVLIDMAGDTKLDGILRSYVPTTLGKLGAPRAAAPLLDVLRDSTAPDAVRQSAAMGLVSLATLHDTVVIDELVDQVRHGHDQLTRHFALITLARLGAQDDDVAGLADTHEALLRLLEKEMSGKSKHRAHRSWAAIGAALYARAHPAAAPRLLNSLRTGFADENDPSYKGAYAMALALSDDQQSAPIIHESMAQSHQDDYRGYASEALGLMGYREAAPLLRELCEDESLPESFRLKAAMGLGLMADGDAVPLLVKSMVATRSLGGLSALAQALGLIGDRSAGLPLLTMAADDKRRELSRAFATVALGLLGERDSLPFNAALRADNNYLHQTPAVAEILRIL
jgi:HEAT repeat protein